MTTTTEPVAPQQSQQQSQQQQSQQQQQQVRRALQPRAPWLRLLPEDGWFTLILLALSVYITVFSIESVTPPWAPGMGILTTTTSLGLLLGYLAVQQGRLPGVLVHSAAVVLGVATRLAAAPIIFFLLVAAFVQNGPGSFSDKELALVYLVPFVTLTLTGGGHYALDTLILRGRAGRRRL